MGNIEKKESIAQIVIKGYAHLAELAKGVSERTQIKLTPIMNNFPKIADDESKESIEYPPLFSELRDYQKIIRNALENIDEYLSRTEI